MKKLITTFREFITRHIIAEHPDEKYNSQTVQDFIKFCWDCREELLRAKTAVELESCYWEVDWLENTYIGLVPKSEIMNQISGLYHIYSARRAEMFARKVG